jgi:8-oxo-dGTP pyrophosphatase MutT (NUDIX family)
MKGLNDREAARIEVEEEAGLIGSARKKPIGSFQYWKRLEAAFELLEAVVYVVDVTGSQPVWKEQAERRVQWMSLDDAAHVVDEPGLVALLQANKSKVSRKRPA